MRFLQGVVRVGVVLLLARGFALPVSASDKDKEKPAVTPAIAPTKFATSDQPSRRGRTR